MYKYTFKQHGRPHRVLLVRSRVRVSASRGSRGQRSLTRRLVSQDAEAKDVPSGDTLTQLTRFSWPNRIEIRFPFRTSHTLMV